MPGMFLQEKTKFLMMIRGVGALTNILLNLLLIPLYGAMGAAWSTCASFAVMAIMIFIMNRKIFPINYEWGRIVHIIVLMTIIYLLSNCLVLTKINKMILSAVFPISLILSGFMTKGERQRLQNVFR